MGEIKNNDDTDIVVLSDKSRKLVDDFSSQVSSVEPHELITKCEGLIQELDKELLGDAYNSVKLTLQSAWFLGTAFEEVATAQINAETIKKFEKAVHGFKQIELLYPADLGIGMLLYAKGLLDIREGNIPLAIQTFQEAEEHLDNAGKFSQDFKPILDAIRPMTIFVSSYSALKEQNFSKAKAIIGEASNAAEKYSSKYCEENTDPYFIFKAMPHLFRSLLNFHISNNALSLYEYDKILNDVDLFNDCQKASDLLSSVKVFNEGTDLLVGLSEILSNFVPVIRTQASIMKKIFCSNITKDLSELSEQYMKLRKIGDISAKTGPTGEPFIMTSENMITQLKNIERLTRPKKRDFGVFSGLLTTLVFSGLFLVTLCANSFWKLGVNPERLAGICVGLALIAGFGYGALRFRSMFFPTKLPAEE